MNAPGMSGLPVLLQPACASRAACLSCRSLHASVGWLQPACVSRVALACMRHTHVGRPACLAAASMRQSDVLSVLPQPACVSRTAAACMRHTQVGRSVCHVAASMRQSGGCSLHATHASWAARLSCCSLHAPVGRPAWTATETYVGRAHSTYRGLLAADVWAAISTASSSGEREETEGSFLLSAVRIR